MDKPPEGSVYIDDGVYAFPAEYGVWLYVFDGYHVTDRVHLEPEMIHDVLRLWQNHVNDRNAKQP